MVNTMKGRTVYALYEIKEKKGQHGYCENINELVYGDVRIPEIIAYGMSKEDADNMCELFSKGHPDRKYFVYPIEL